MKATTYALLVLTAGAAFAQDRLEVIPLRHATVEQVLPVLRPLLAPGGAMTGQRNQLIVRTTPQNLEELRRALAVIDAPARRLEILVRFDSAGEDASAAVQADARVSNRGSRIEIRGGASRSSASERVDQRVQVLEGRRAWISAGTSRPYRNSVGTEYHDAASGFEVVPRIAGGRVILQVAAQRQGAGASPGSVDSFDAATTVRAGLGEWVEIGGLAAAASRSDRGLAAGAGQSGSSGRRIWVRVDEVGP
ncbi:MAG TPA: secretin N-terminal domain-containing protein [Burkholderiales bacterium]|nr:secretin N-terminal domain-containing protein [Burkholderiales bacterium]